MTREADRGGSAGRRRRWTAALAAAIALGGCATTGGEADPTRPVLAQADPGEGALAVETALRYARIVRTLGPAELEQERQSLALAAGHPLNRVLQALALAQAPGANLPRALALLDAVEASTSADAVALHPLVRALADQFAERLRLEGAAQRFAQQLERTGQQLKETHRHADQLQEKLDALTEIERSLTQRAAPSPAPLPQPPTERRPPR